MDGLAVSILFLVILSFLLFVIRVALIFYHNILLARELKRMTQEAEARRRQNPVVAADNNQTNEPPKDDLPPAYDDVVQAKLALQAAAEEGRAAQTNGDSSMQSTITLATLVETSGSNANLSAHPRSSTATVESNETLPPAYENAVFEHDETTMNDRRNENTNSHSQN